VRQAWSPRRRWEADGSSCDLVSPPGASDPRPRLLRTEPYGRRTEGPGSPAGRGAPHGCGPVPCSRRHGSSGLPDGPQSAKDGVRPRSPTNKARSGAESPRSESATSPTPRARRESRRPGSAADAVAPLLFSERFEQVLRAAKTQTSLLDPLDRPASPQSRPTSDAAARSGSTGARPPPPWSARRVSESSVQGSQKAPPEDRTEVSTRRAARRKRPARTKCSVDFGSFSAIMRDRYGAQRILESTASTGKHQALCGSGGGGQASTAARVGTRHDDPFALSGAG